MIIRKFSLFVLITLFTLPILGQQKVDLDQALAENPNLYTCGFTRLGVGISGASYSYGDIFDGLSLSPLRFHLDFGKRMSRSYGIYFTITGDVLLREVYSGNYLMNNWAQVGMNIGGLFYIKGGRSYIAPEIGLGIIAFEYFDSYSGYVEDAYTMGIGGSLKYGYDRHISGKVSVGGQLYITYTSANETDPPSGYDPYKGKSFIYGVSINLKFGK
jgi:hypothetical protein